MASISIQEAYAMVNDPEISEFSIGFVRATGKSKGSICRVKRARRGRTKGYEKAPGSSSGSSDHRQARHTDIGTIPLVDIDQDRYFTPLISHIIEFNQFKVIH